jgi:methionyl-tRNA formyltransferase
MLGDQPLRILQASVTHINGTHTPGNVIDEPNGLTVVCGQDALVLHQVQPAGSKALAASDWRRGLRTLPIIGETIHPAQ